MVWEADGASEIPKLFTEAVFSKHAHIHHRSIFSPLAIFSKQRAELAERPLFPSAPLEYSP